MFPNFYVRQIKGQIRRVGLAETCRRLAAKQVRAAAKAAKAGDYDQACYYSAWAARHKAMLARQMGVLANRREEGQNMFPNCYVRQIKEQIRRVGLAETCCSLAGKQARAAAKAGKAGDYDQARYYSAWAARHEAMLARLEMGVLANRREEGQNMFPNFYVRQIKGQIRRVGLAETCCSLAGKRDRAAAKAGKAGDYAQARYYSAWAARHKAMLPRLETGNLC